MIVALPGLFSYLFRKPLTSRLELDDLSGLARRGLNIVFLFTLAHSNVSHKYSYLCIILMNLIFMFSF